VDCVPGLLGYVGVDVTLGDTKDGSRDFAIEINPRLTTSYVGLRAISRTNLAEAMLQVVQGEPLPVIHWHNQRVAWSPDGTVRKSEA
jgi:predicted ATP-grasp superfamily ATP-dependent carboligase